jgi:6-phosphogluconolactonase (cycloisomerase 2 family)
VRLVRPLLILAALLVLAAPMVSSADAAGGGLRFVECLTAVAPERGEPRTPRGGGCRLARTVAPNGEGTGIDYLSGLTASPDGRSLYGVSSRDDSLAAFATGPLGMTQCFTTDPQVRSRGKRPCQLLPGSGGADSGALDNVRFVAVSPDGQDVYTAADGSIATFARAASGRLTFAGVFTGLAEPRSLAISPDGRFAYVALGAAGGIATLARAADGSLQFVSCLRGVRPGAETAARPCPLVAPEANNPNRSGLSSPTRMAISADGTSLYATSAHGASIAEFRRDPVTGALTFSGCLSAANRGTGPGDPCRYVPQANEIGVVTSMYEMREIAIDPDGTGLYGVSTVDDSVAAFARDPTDGRLTFASCIAAESTSANEFGVRDPCTRVPSTDKVGNGSGLYEPRGLAVSPDGRDLFVASRGDATVDRFRIAPGGGLRVAGCVTNGAGRVARCSRARAPGGKPQYFGFDGFDSIATAGHDVYASAGDGPTISRFSFP